MALRLLSAPLTHTQSMRSRAASLTHHMTSPWQHMHYEHAHYMINGKSDTPTRKMCCTYPRLNRYHDNTKLACHRRARSKMEWIYTRTKVSGHGSLELALEMKKKKKH